MPQVDVATLRAAQRFAKMDYDKQVAAQGGAGGAGLEAAGPPTWSRAAWDAFYAQFGKYPFSATELPPSFENCPDWAYELMGLRVPPVRVVGGQESTGSGRVDNLPIWGMR